MAAYRLYTVVPRLVKFVDQLTNWYVRMNRRRLRGEMGLEDCCNALNTLFSVLFTMTKVMVGVVELYCRCLYVKQVSTFHDRNMSAQCRNTV